MEHWSSTHDNIDVRIFKEKIMLNPEVSQCLDQLSGELEGQAKIVKVNVDEARELAVKYNVKSIPLLLFFKNGEVKDQIVGANITKDQLKAKLLALA